MTSWKNTKIKAFIDKYNWEEIIYLSEKDDWKKFEKNNLTIADNVLNVQMEKLSLVYISKHNWNYEKLFIL